MYRNVLENMTNTQGEIATISNNFIMEFFLTV